MILENTAKKKKAPGFAGLSCHRLLRFGKDNKCTDCSAYFALQKKELPCGCTEFLPSQEMDGKALSATIAAVLSFQAVHFVNFLLVLWEHVAMPQLRLLRSPVACVQLELMKFKTNWSLSFIIKQVDFTYTGFCQDCEV